MFQILFLFFLNFFKIDKLITDVDLFEVNKFFFNYRVSPHPHPTFSKIAKSHTCTCTRTRVPKRTRAS